MQRTIFDGVRTIPLSWKSGNYTTANSDAREARLRKMFNCRAIKGIQINKGDQYPGRTFIDDEGWACIVTAFKPNKKYCIECYCENGQYFGLTEMGLYRYMA